MNCRSVIDVTSIQLSFLNRAIYQLKCWITAVQSSFIPLYANRQLRYLKQDAAAAVHKGKHNTLCQHMFKKTKKGKSKDHEAVGSEPTILSQKFLKNIKVQHRQVISLPNMTCIIPPNTFKCIHPRGRIDGVCALETPEHNLRTAPVCYTYTPAARWGRHTASGHGEVSRAIFYKISLPLSSSGNTTDQSALLPSSGESV